VSYPELGAGGDTLNCFEGDHGLANLLCNSKSVLAILGQLINNFFYILEMVSFLQILSTETHKEAT
jgi:hypothetical protein